MKKKIGQVTYGSDNYGSILQCYALQRLLEERNVECQLLKISDSNITRSFKALIRRMKCLKKKTAYPQERKKINQLLTAATEGTSHLSDKSHRAMRDFCDKHLNTKNISSLKLRRAAEGNEYLGFFSGSDQIWSANYPVVNPFYFLRFAPSKKRVAYAPSFGAKEIPAYNRKEFQKYISEYAMLSVREESGVGLISNLVNRDAVTMNDPVFHLKQEMWDNLASSSALGDKQDNYCLLFFLNEPTESTEKQIAQILQTSGLTIKYFAYSYSWEGIDGEFVDGGPEDFLNMIKHSTLVLTDSFHAMSFSLIFNTPFIAMQRNYSHSSDQSNRLIELLESCGLRNQFIQNGQEILKDTSAQINFERFNQYYGLIQEKAEQFLTDALNYLEDDNGIVR